MFKLTKPAFIAALLSLLLMLPMFGICQISVPEWVKDIGGPNGSSSVPSAVVNDSQNNIYITGIFSGTVDFDPTAGVHELNSVGSFDTYLAKYTTDGNLIWAVSVGGDGIDQANSMTIDNDGNPSISGQFDSGQMDADPGPGVHNLTNNGGSDAFIIRFTTNGAFSWATSIGSSGTEYGGKIMADNQGNVIEVSQFQGTVNVGNKTFTAQGNFNGLMVKFDAAGHVTWAIDLKDNNNSEAHSCSVDKNNNVIVSGTFSSNVNFNPLGAAHNLNGNGVSTFLAKYTPAGQLIWVKAIKGDVVNNNTNVCVNSNNDIYI
ncbi:hypothetical protein SNE25_29985 [Mucilaginibacter sabulilitoris]|uniref:Uncharacterized protein n=1 Tax=Mucilaginibacter sabulilitoris TaxID=1173583 RepID=A0ABZ0TK48_9SPHI|nr:hypothetical protein [Mucilaginibacter sabulilitoris]WPU93551.1 hypothetical protein SNE25_29985 [Mucilaginibacter sabulilitoris]